MAISKHGNKVLLNVWLFPFARKWPGLEHLPFLCRSESLGGMGRRKAMLCNWVFHLMGRELGTKCPPFPCCSKVPGSVWRREAGESYPTAPLHCILTPRARPPLIHWRRLISNDPHHWLLTPGEGNRDHSTPRHERSPGGYSWHSLSRAPGRLELFLIGEGLIRNITSINSKTT